MQDHFGRIRRRIFGPAMRVGATITVFAVLTGACSSGTVPAAQMKLDIANSTTLVVTLAVNGVAVKAIPPGDDAEFTADQLPPLPWNAEAQTSSGRGLLGLRVKEGDVWIGGNGQGGDAARVDLSCGRIDMWSGPPLAGPMPGAGTSGDCAP